MAMSKQCQCLKDKAQLNPVRESVEKKPTWVWSRFTRSVASSSSCSASFLARSVWSSKALSSSSSDWRRLFLLSETASCSFRSSFTCPESSSCTWRSFNKTDVCGFLPVQLHFKLLCLSKRTPEVSEIAWGPPEEFQCFVVGEGLPQHCHLYSFCGMLFKREKTLCVQICQSSLFCLRQN